MTEPVRRNLLAGLERAAPAKSEPDEAAIAAVAQRHGFAKTEAAAASPAADEGGQVVTMRRKRKLLGRTQQFNVRLRPETVDVIYEEANRRDVAVATVIEEMVEAFQAARGHAET